MTATDIATRPEMPLRLTFSAETNELSAALVKFQSAVSPVGKDKTAKIKTKSGYEYTYSYADLATVIEATREARQQAGIAVVQFPTGSESGVTLVTRVMHASGQWLQADLTMRPADTTPQTIGSLITYLRRYCYSAALGICTEDDDDGAGAQDAAKGKREQYGAPRGGSPQQPPKASGERDGTVPGSQGSTSRPTGSNGGAASGGPKDIGGSAGTAVTQGATPATQSSATTTGEATKRNSAIPPATSKRPTADKVKHCGILASAAQVQKIQILRRECGGTFVGDDDNPQSLWRIKVLGVYRDQKDERITSTKALCKVQASHCIERLTEYKAKVTAALDRRGPIDIGPANDNDQARMELAAAISKASSNPGEYDDLLRDTLAPFGLDEIGDLTEEQARLALALVTNPERRPEVLAEIRGE